ncbi:MAG: aminotransferase class V-fold PLP-dependent enzyme [Steroidobacteraceae bacterium]|nr:aminotransferase class V-fold PLP-dependent enzyme [Steroidobacteraceae bacterium]
MNRAGPIYLDWAATAPLDRRVADAMCACLADPAAQANPSSGHASGRAAAALVARARGEVAALIGAPAESIVFTSGATESVNLAILGTARASPREHRHVVCSRVEHRAVTGACRQLEREVFEVSWLSPAAGGAIEPAAVAAALRPDTALVTLMQVNNETGALTDIAAVAKLCRERSVPLHVDAAQSAGKLPIDVAVDDGIALLSFCAHKLGGPKGIGALYQRRQPRPALQPLMSGGSHEAGLRPGTLATPQIVGFGAACRIARESLATEPARIRALRERLWQALQPAAPLWRNGVAEPSAPGILNAGFAGVEGESLLLALDGEVDVASGAACHSAVAEPSDVLRALGRSDLAIQASLRFSLGSGTTEAEVDRAAGLVVAAVRRLRSVLPAGALERVA